jgi:ATP-dependent Zn protease
VCWLLVVLLDTPLDVLLLLGHIIDDEWMRVCCCAGYTLFVEDEAARANALLSRGDMEAVMVVHLAGRAAEKMVMGEAEVRQAAHWWYDA